MLLSLRLISATSRWISAKISWKSAKLRLKSDEEWTKSQLKPIKWGFFTFGKPFNRSLVRTGVWRLVWWNRPRTLETAKRRRKSCKKGTFIFCAKLWYAPNPGSKEIWHCTCKVVGKNISRVSLARPPPRVFPRAHPHGVCNTAWAPSPEPHRRHLDSNHPAKAGREDVQTSFLTSLKTVTSLN